MPHHSQIVGGTDSARTSADDRNLLPCCRSRLLTFTVYGNVSGIVDRVELQAPDVDSVVNHAAAALVLAGVLADHCANAGERVIFAYEPYCVGVTSSVHERDIARNVDVCRAKGNAWDCVEAVCGAMMAFGSVSLVILAEAPHSLENHVSGLVAYCAVSGVGDSLCGFLDGFDGLHVSFAVDEVIDEPFELWKSDAAGDTFSACLSGADFQVAAGEVERAEAGRCSDDSAFEILVKRLNGGLSFSLINNAKATQNRFTPSLRMFVLSFTNGIEILYYE